MDNRYLASCSSDRSVRIWDFETFEQCSYIFVGKEIIRLEFSPSTDDSNKCILVACKDAKIRIYRWEKNQKLFSTTVIWFYIANNY
jgi:WD40 repeat protein